jgi:hypothetical protein
MKTHPVKSAELVAAVSHLRDIVPAIRHHHENWDGTGYPDGLAGEAIPRGARILSVVDCFDALTSDRPYRPRMTDAQALEILRERRGTMYDPTIVDAFLSAHERIMPVFDPTPHPASRVIGDARALERAAVEPEPEPASESVMSDGLLAVASLSRAVSGDAGIADIGALLWTILKQALACDAMAIFVVDGAGDHVVPRYAAGLHAARLRSIRSAMGSGIVGWVAATLKPATNVNPSLDVGFRTDEGSTTLRSCLAVPLVESGSLVAVLALYRCEADSFSEDHARLLELLGARLCAPLSAARGADAPAIQPVPLSLVRRAGV